MKPRLSFVSSGARRPSMRPKEDDTSSTAGMPSPEPMGGTPAPAPVPEELGGSAIRPRGSALGSPVLSGSVPGASRATIGSSPLATQGKSRNKSVVEGLTSMSIGGGSVIQPPVSPKGSITASRPSAIGVVLRSGFLKKKGVINSAWRKRYFVLTDQIIGYFDDEPKEGDSSEPKGFIALELITKVEHHDDNANEDFKFDVITPTRVYKLQAASVSEMEAWIATISGTAGNTQQHMRRRLPTTHGGIARDMTEDTTLQGEDITAAFGGPHQPADLRKWELWKAYDVSAWLETFGMSKHKKKFYAAGMTGAHLKGLSSETLNSLGVTEKAEQIKILNNVQRLMSGGA